MSKPVHKIRDGLLTANIWANEMTDKGVFYSVTFERSYKDGEEWKSTNSYSNGDILKMARLAEKAYDKIRDLRNGEEQS